MGDRNLTPKQFGALGEQYAAAWLEEHGWTTLSRNWHTRYGELDIVMLNPEYTVVFVESEITPVHALRISARGHYAGETAQSQESRLRLAT